MNRIYLTAIALLTAMLLLVGGWALSLNTDISGLRIENTALTEAAERATERANFDRQLLVARQDEMALQARKLAQAQRSLSEALQRNKQWSDTDVPPDVQKALGGPTGGLPASL